VCKKITDTFAQTDWAHEGLRGCWGWNR
jgi:hypothetical protein